MITLDEAFERTKDILFGPSTSASRDEVLMMYEMLATFGLVMLFFFDAVACILESTPGKVALMMNAMAMLYSAAMVADLQAIESCNPAPESPKVAFVLFWMMVGRLAYQWPNFIIHSTKGDAHGSFFSVFEIGSVIFTSCNSIFLFRAWKRLRETSPLDHPVRNWDIQYGLFMPKLGDDDLDGIELGGIDSEKNSLSNKYGATSGEEDPFKDLDQPASA